MARNVIGRSDELPERGALRFRIRHRGRQTPAFAVRVDGVIRAYLNICTHRELELDLGTGVFFSQDGALLICKAHGARYQPEDGACAGGICQKGSSLTPIEVVEVGGVIYVEEG